MKKQTRFVLIALCLLAVTCVLVFSSCKQNVQITVDLGLDGTDVQTFTVDKDIAFYDRLADYIPANNDGLVFLGWVDENGAEVTEATRWDKDGKVIAQWSAMYKTEYYLETDDGFIKSDELTTTRSNILGADVSAEELAIDGYYFDSANDNNVDNAVLTKNTTLKLYYKRIMFKITFDKNNVDAVGDMATLFCPSGATVALTPNAFESKYEFGGWSTKPNGLGDFYVDGANISTDGNITLYAQWKITYIEEVWVERFDGSDYIYVKEKYGTMDGYLGNGASVGLMFEQEHYSRDYTHKDAVWDCDSLADGAVLKAFYSLDRFMVTYKDDETHEEVRYGEKYVIRTPEQDEESDVVIMSYNSSPDGNGREYKFGDTVVVEGDLTLYPVTVTTPADADNIDR